MNFKTPSSDPPAREMQFFPRMTSALPSKSIDYRRVLWTGLYSQLVIMSIPEGGVISEETHSVDQALTFTSGTGLARVGGRDQEISAGDMVIVPAGTPHQFLNTGPMPLMLYIVYSPAEHAATTVHRTKQHSDREEGQPPGWSQRTQEENERWLSNGH
ncbi:cupin domain-containing protein [Plectosphaerella plurivora]|uniref:Cupin domain-containing protein n=1 Tax=Plectosphaerella plurivora TaxID=936078 RepID=A0A9P9A905_9PEZI|nr:cupin domain-containing protein [Plectosphaerella plurivora]